MRPIYNSTLCLLLSILFLLLGKQTLAQDPSFSQFYANRVYLNPAFTGIEGGISISGVSRTQWAAVDKGFRTLGFTAETQLPFVRLGLGLQILQNVEGLANLGTKQIGLAFSYTIPGNNNNIHIGFETKMVQKTLDWDKLLFSDQLDPIYGVVQPTTLAPVLDQLSFADVNFGIVWRRHGDIGRGKKRMRDVRSHLGISLNHLPNLFSQSAEGNDSFLNRDSKIAPRITFHGGMIIPMKIFKGTGFEMSLSPNFKFDAQGYDFLNFKENITVGTGGVYALINNLYAGILYQNRYFAPNATHTDSFILTVGGYTLSSSGNQGKGGVPRLFFGASVDVNSMGVGPAAGSIFEFNIRYRFVPDIRAKLGRGNSKSKKILDCKDFF